MARFLPCCVVLVTATLACSSASYPGDDDPAIDAGLDPGLEFEMVPVFLANTEFDLESLDLGNFEDTCIATAPWGTSTWGVEATSDGPDNRIDAARFASWDSDGYFYGKEESGILSTVRYGQGDIWGQSPCGAITWLRPAPLVVGDKALFLDATILPDTYELTTPNDSALAMTFDFYLTSAESSRNGNDVLGRKPLALHLNVFDECNRQICGTTSIEEADTFRYYVEIDRATAESWNNYSIELSPYIELAADYYSLPLDSLQLYEASFSMELRNATGAASITKFAINERRPVMP